MILEQNLFYEESFEGHYLFLLFEHQTTIWSYPFGNFHLLTILSQLNSVAQSCSNLWIRTAAPQASLSITNSQSLHKLMSIELVMPSNHLIILCRPLLLLPLILLSITVFSSEAVLHIRWPKYWSFSLSIIPSNEYSGLISFSIDWFDPLAV